MPFDASETISDLIDEAGKIESESETSFLELGKIFPRLFSEMEKSSAAGEDSLRVLDEVGSQGGLGHAAGSRGDADFVKEARAYFESLRERDTFFLERVKEGITRLGAFDEIIARVRSDSEEMEIISLNAMTVALKTGAEGKAFSVITDELKRLSSRTIGLTEGVNASGRALLNFFDRLRSALAELDAFQRDFFSSIDVSLVAGFEETTRKLSDASTFFSALIDEARGIRGPVLRVMDKVQIQDIVRQSLQHVGLSLAEASEAAASEGHEDAAFVAAVAKLTQGLVEDVAVKIEESVGSFAEDIGAVDLVVGEGESKRQAYFDRESTLGAVDSNGFRAGSERYLSLKRDIAAMASRLSDNVVGLERSFKTLSALLSRFQNIVVASRIEVAKTAALSGVVTTVKGMIALTERIEADVGESMGTTKDFTKLTSGAIGSYSKDADADRLAATLGEVEGAMARLGQARARLGAGIRDFSLYTDDFIASIHRAEAEISKLRGLAERLRALGGRLGELEARISKDLGPKASEVEPARMRRMVERFTIFTHKKAGGDIGRFEVEEGRASGEVTLF
jgi:hypothetical protein